MDGIHALKTKLRALLAMAEQEIEGDPFKLVIHLDHAKNMGARLEDALARGGDAQSPPKESPLRRMTRDLRNPHADKRCKDRFNAEAVWCQGTLIRVFERDFGIRDAPHVVRFIDWPGREYGGDSVQERDERFEELMDASEPVPLDTFDAVDQCYRHQYRDKYHKVVKNLVHYHLVELSTIRAMLENEDAWDEDLEEQDGE